MENPSDNELIERTTGGDRAAFETLARRHYQLVYRAAFKWCGAREAAEDVAQEVFIKVARSIGKFKGDSALTTWLYRITVNTAKDLHRSEGAKRRREETFANESKWEADGRTHDNPVADGAVYEALDTLSEKLKEAALLVLAEGMSHREAAAVIGCAETTVSWRVFQARKKLRHYLEKEVA